MLPVASCHQLTAPSSEFQCCRCRRNQQTNPPELLTKLVTPKLRALIFDCHLTLLLLLLLLPSFLYAI